MKEILLTFPATRAEMLEPVNHGTSVNLGKANMAQEARFLKHGTHLVWSRRRAFLLKNEAVAPNIIAVNLH